MSLVDTNTGAAERVACLLAEPSIRWIDKPTFRTVTDSVNVRYRTEADLRDGLAAVAHACGWHVATEVVIPGWGRVDLIVMTAKRAYAIEVKKELRRAAQARMAVQQIEGYVRQLEDAYVWPEYIAGIVTAATYEPEIVSAATKLYGGVWGYPAGVLLNILRTSGDLTTALDRIEADQRIVRLRRAAFASMTKEDDG